MNNISIRKMRILIAAAEEGNFTRAAMRENISQPAATIIVNEIEATIGQELFVRRGTARKAILTDLGKTIAETFSRIVAGYDMELSRIGSRYLANRSVKRILVQSTFIDAVDPEWLFSLCDLIVGDRLIIEEGTRDEIVNQISAREAAVGLVDGHVDKQQCDANIVETFRIGLAVPESSDLASSISGTLDWDEIDDECYVLTGLSEESLRVVNRMLSQAGRSVSDFHIMNGLSALRAAAAIRPLPIIMPDVLSKHLRSSVPYQFHDIGAAPIQTQFSVIAPWGYMNQIDFKPLRELKCFRRDNET